MLIPLLQGRVFLPLAATLAVLLFGAASASTAQPIKAGQAGYLTSPRSGDATAPPLRPRGEQMRGRAAPTNQWYSSLLFSAEPEPIYAQPLSVRAVSAGLEMALPQKAVVPTERRDVEILYAHRYPVLLSPADFTPGQARLSSASDWAIDIEWGSAQQGMVATVAHGSPYVFLRVTSRALVLTLPEPAEQLTVPASSKALAIRSKGAVYAFFAANGTRWEQQNPTTWIAHFPEGNRFISASALPQNNLDALELLEKHAFAQVISTAVSWDYQQATGLVTSRFLTQTKVAQGQDHGPLQGLYPHHWNNNATLEGRLGPSYDTVRGPIRLLAAQEFSVQRRYSGFVPYWPGLTSAEQRAQLEDVMSTDLRNARRMMLEIGNGTYWQGKGLQRISKLMEVFEQHGKLAERNQLLALLKNRVEEWFSAENRKTYFSFDSTLGTLLAYPEEYFSVQQLNDHHFHYGYWIRAFADIALRDPDWASASRWGGLIPLLVGDVATQERASAKFPFLRTFDAYEGHSWASGIALGPDGNNQESSSEAINAWAALILWGELSGDKSLRDLGVFLYTSEAEAIRYYWFDVHRLVFAPEYKGAEVSMLFGGKYSHNTWWTDEPRQIKGINLLPMTSASVYLAKDPEHIARSLATLPADSEVYAARGKRANPPDIWQDIFAKYLALANPEQALKSWNRWGAVELGDTRTHTLHWLLSLQQMGQPDLEVSANTTLYSVFKRPDGQRTYLAFNAGSTPLSVTFSTGKTMTVPPKQLQVEN